MKCFEYGKEHKDTILLLHGGGLSWWNYREAAKLLESRFHVVLPILDGHGESDAPFTSIEHNAGELISYIDEQFGGHVLLIGGLSLGGQVLLEMLAQRRDICSFAVIESALVLPRRLTAALIKPAYALCYPLVKQRWFAKLQFRALHIKAALFEEYFADTSKLSKTNMTAFLKANSTYCLKETLADCRAKALILAGSKELPVMIKSAKRISACLPSSKLEILKHFRHGDCSINHAQQYVEKLLRLIQR